MLVVVVGGFAGPLVPAAGAETRLDVTAGYAGFHVPGRAVPVQVTVSAERLVNGELAVLAGRGNPVASLPVEVAGGSVKRFTLVVPGGVMSSASGLDVELRAGGRALGRGRAEVRSADDAELVGLGPRLVEGRTLPGPAPLAVDVGVARFAALDAGLLAQAPASLDGLSAVGLASGELAGLAPGVRAGLLRWVAGGGRLLLDEAAGAAIDGLPGEWHPGPSGRAAAGMGEVRLTGDAMSAGRWAGLVEPSSVGRSDTNGFFSGESVGDSLARDAGLRLPGLPWLLGFLGVYIAAVGPVTGFVLRRRRRPDFAWVVVPGLAVAFTVLAYVAGNQLRPGSGLAHGSVVETGASGPVATSWVALTRRSAGTAHVDLPAGWAAESNPAAGSRHCFEACPDVGTPSVGAGGDGPELRLPLATGEFGVFKASGPVSLPGRLEVTASSASDGEARGTVRNRLPFPLEQVVVFVGSSRVRVGRLGPGEQREWAVGPGDRVFDPSGSEAWASEFGALPQDGVVNIPLWQSAQRDLGQDGDLSGNAMAVGWTREWKPAFTVDGKERHARGRTAVVGRAPVTAADGRVTDVTVGVDVVRGPALSAFGGRWIGDNPGEPSVVKLTLPTAVTGGAGAGAGKARRPLVLRTSLTLSDVAVWRNGAWQPLSIPFDPNDPRALLRWKREIAIGGGRIVMDAPAPPLPPRPGLVNPPTTVVIPPGMPPAPVTTTAPPIGGPGGWVGGPAVAVPPGGNATVDIPLPDGIGGDGVLFLRLVADPGSLRPDATLSLVEVAR